MNKANENTKLQMQVTGPDGPPDARLIERWIGTVAYEYWNRITVMIGELYLGVDEPNGSMAARNTAGLYDTKRTGPSVR